MLIHVAAIPYLNTWESIPYVNTCAYVNAWTVPGYCVAPVRPAGGGGRAAAVVRRRRRN